MLKQIVPAVFAISAALVGVNAAAASMTNPDPLIFGEDLNDNGYFSVTAPSLFATKVFDVGEQVLGTVSEFGIFRRGSDVTDLTSLIPIFGADDLHDQTAVVDFQNGIVVDVDQAAVQSAFGSGRDFGFYMNVKAVGVTFYSDPALNFGGGDFFGVFPLLGNSGALALYFQVPGPSGIDLVGVDVVNAIAPAASPVPVPAPVWLLGSACGLGGLLARRRRAASAR